ncbi:hypothetical protein [Streptomyces sp. CoH27]|uniref:hypothetical protein n=1 Tax=Streptomyces sp. CoH27 TaxID=2875763 RepID=UPI001CD2DDCD|nr:hypothetical protein [Streptomyces sp. CoH27]
MSTPVPRSRRRLRVPAPGAAAPRQPVDQAKVGRRSVRRRATGMTATEAAAALEEAELQRHVDRGREELADDERGSAEFGEWQRIAQLLATTGGVYDPEADAVVQDALAADAEDERVQQLQDEQRRQEQETEAACRAALAPDSARTSGRPWADCPSPTRLPRSPSTRCSPACTRPAPQLSRGPRHDGPPGGAGGRHVGGTDGLRHPPRDAHRRRPGPRQLHATARGAVLRGRRRPRPHLDLQLPAPLGPVLHGVRRLRRLRAVPRAARLAPSPELML